MEAQKGTVEQRLRERLVAARSRLARLGAEREALLERVREYAEILGETAISTPSEQPQARRRRASQDEQAKRIEVAKSVLERAGKPMRMGDLHDAVVAEIGAEAAGKQAHFSAILRRRTDQFEQGLRGYWSLRG